MNNQEKVLVLGGSGFFGEAVYRKFTDEGYDVIIGDARPPSFEGVADIEYHKVDVTNEQSLTSLRHVLDEAEKPVSHIINFVGGLVERNGMTNLFATSVEEIEQTIRKNLMSQILPVRFLGEHLARQEDGDKSITLMSSINASMGYSIPFYSAAKGGIESFIRPAAVDLGRYGIRINAVAPGTVHTPSSAKQQKNFEARRESAPLKRLATPDDITEAFMSCVRMKAYTGQTLVVDGGQSKNPSESLYDQERHNLIKKTPEVPSAHGPK